VMVSATVGKVSVVVRKTVATPVLGRDVAMMVVGGAHGPVGPAMQMRNVRMGIVSQDRSVVRVVVGIAASAPMTRHSLAPTALQIQARTGLLVMAIRIRFV